MRAEGNSLSHDMLAGLLPVVVWEGVKGDSGEGVEGDSREGVEGDSGEKVEGDSKEGVGGSVEGMEAGDSDSGEGVGGEGEAGELVTVAAVSVRLAAHVDSATGVVTKVASPLDSHSLPVCLLSVGGKALWSSGGRVVPSEWSSGGRVVPSEWSSGGRVVPSEWSSGGRVVPSEWSSGGEVVPSEWSSGGGDVPWVGSWGGCVPSECSSGRGEGVGEATSPLGLAPLLVGACAVGVEAGAVFWVVVETTSDEPSGEGTKNLFETSFEAATSTPTTTARRSRKHTQAPASLEKRSFPLRLLVLTSNPLRFRDGFVTAGSSRSWLRS